MLQRLHFFWLVKKSFDRGSIFSGWLKNHLTEAPFFSAGEKII
jgi:hypothetical protein